MGSNPEVRLTAGEIHSLEALREEGGSVIIGDAGKDNAVLALCPIDRGGDLVRDGQLKRVDRAEDLVEAPASARGVGQGELDLAVLADDEHGADGEREPLGVGGVVGRDHAVLLGNGAGGVGDDGEADARAAHGGALAVGRDVGEPAVVGGDVVARQGQALDAALLELRQQLGHAGKLGGADRGEVGRVREEDGPRVVDVLVEVDRAVGGVRGEVGRFVAEQERHRAGGRLGGGECGGNGGRGEGWRIGLE